MTIKYIIMWAAIIYGILETVIGIRSRIGLNKNDNKDYGSYLLIFLALFLGFYISFQIYFRLSAGSLFRNPLYPFAAGTIIIITGIILRAAAILTLKKQFTFSVMIFDEHKLMDSGIYHYLRHPSYLGQLLISAGFGIAMNNWICICIMIIPVLAALIYRIRVEEKALLEKFGSGYSGYMKKTRAILPFIY
ncbi:MAG: isoprenylcysteine carboxylmethyltransferase family protein [Brevinematales bacterium]